MRQEDRISIAVYSGSAGLVLPTTPGSRTGAILKAIDDLEAGGSTAGGEGIELAYETAKKAFIPVLTGIHLAFGSPPSAGSPMLPDLSYMMTRFTAGSVALLTSVTHAAFVPIGSLLNSPGLPATVP